MSLVVRFRETFRERAMEWALAMGLTAWGLEVLQPDAMFTRPFFAPLLAIAPENIWGWASFLIGLMRLVVLFINGAWWRTPQFRQIGCVFGLCVWSGLVFGALSVDFRTPAVATYTILFVMDAMSLSFAAGDAKKVADSVRQRAGALANGCR